MKQWLLMACAGVLGILVSGTSAKAVTVSLDLDPVTPGIQNNPTVFLGSSVTADVLITDLTDFLQGFELDVDFASSVVTATSVASGGFLPNPFSFENDVTPPDVNYSEGNLGVSTATGDGVLASIVFDTVSLGMVDVLLNDVILAGVRGPGDIFEITPIMLQNAKINVVAVPVPAALPLFVTGLVGLIGFQQYRTRRTT